MKKLSKNRKAALAALHALRKGRRVNKPGLTEHQLNALLSDVQATVREPKRGVRSIRQLAHTAGVADKTVRRWLNGRCWPAAKHVNVLRLWVQAFNIKPQ